MANETLTEPYISEGVNYVTYLSQTITEKVVDFLSDNGWNVSQRWVSLMLFFVSALIIYIAMKLTQPFLKWTLIGFAILLTLGLIIPW